tara:strand:+ start:3830 stop:3982 length:153 start_codon:yes stop_codon:yes gene_type:complete
LSSYYFESPNDSNWVIENKSDGDIIFLDNKRYVYNKSKDIWEQTGVGDDE